MTLSIAARNSHQRVDRMGARFVSLHVGDPGTSGAREVDGEYYRRQPVTWDQHMRNTEMAEFVLPGCTPTHVGYWNLETGGTFWNGAPVPQETRFDEGDHAQFPAGALSLVTEG